MHMVVLKGAGAPGEFLHAADAGKAQPCSFMLCSPVG